MKYLIKGLPRECLPRQISSRAPKLAPAEASTRTTRPHSEEGRDPAAAGLWRGVRASIIREGIIRYERRHKAPTRRIFTPTGKFKKGHPGFNPATQPTQDQPQDQDTPSPDFDQAIIKAANNYGSGIKAKMGLDGYVAYLRDQRPVEYAAFLSKALTGQGRGTGQRSRRSPYYGDRIALSDRSLHSGR